MFPSLQKDSTKCALQFGFNNFIPMATYWVPDFPNIKGISGHPLRSIFIFANGVANSALLRQTKYTFSLNID